MIENERKKLEMGEEAGDPREEAKQIMDKPNGIVVIGVKDGKVMSSSGGSMSGGEMVDLIESLSVIQQDLIETIEQIHQYQDGDL